jgi:hypothetical protein
MARHFGRCRDQDASSGAAFALLAVNGNQDRSKSILIGVRPPLGCGTSAVLRGVTGLANDLSDQHHHHDHTAAPAATFAMLSGRGAPWASTKKPLT